MLRFTQVDVFTAAAYLGNPVAVVHDAGHLTDEQMAGFARWTNLSETTFLVPPTDPGADYRLRIFTTERELPFAGHPTLGSARAWLEAGGQPRSTEQIVQECAAGLVAVRRNGTRLEFAAPPLKRSGPVDPADLAQIAAALRITVDEIVDAQWADNGPGWVAVLLSDADAVLAVRPDPAGMGTFTDIGVVGPHPAGGEADFELRAFMPGGAEDPVTGSLNASVAQWLTATGRAPDVYVAAQGTAMGRRGRVHIERRGDQVWVGGDTVVAITGSVLL